MEPDNEYTASNSVYCESNKDEDSKYKISSITFERDHLYGNCKYYYSLKTLHGMETAFVFGTAEQPFWLQKYEEVKKNPELLEKFNNIGRAYYINARSFGVMTTNDVTGIPAFNLGYMYIKDGRVISEEEYCSGCYVCMLSKELARTQGWNIGS